MNEWLPLLGQVTDTTALGLLAVVIMRMVPALEQLRDEVQAVRQQLKRLTGTDGAEEEKEGAGPKQAA